MSLAFFVNVLKARFRTSATASFWAAFGLLLFAVLALGFIFNRQDGLRIRVGVLRPQTERTAALLSHFETYAEGNCDIAVYENEEQMKLDVSASKLECAYVFDGEKITAYRSPWTVADKILDLMVAAVYTEGLAGELGAEVLEGLARAGGVVTEEADSVGEETAIEEAINEDGGNDAASGSGVIDFAADIQARADEYLKDGALMEMEYVEMRGGASSEEGIPQASGESVAAEESRGEDITEEESHDVSMEADASSNNVRAPYYRLFHGLVGLAGLLLALLCAMGLSGEAEKAAAVRLQAANVFSAAGMIIIFLLTFAFILAAFAAGSLMFPGVVDVWPEEIFSALAFALAAAGISSLLSVLLPSDVFPAVISFVFIFAAVFGGAVFDIREVFESAAPLRYLFPNYYFMSGNIAVLLGIGVVSGAGAVIIRKYN